MSAARRMSLPPTECVSLRWEPELRAQRGDVGARRLGSRYSNVAPPCGRVRVLDLSGRRIVVTYNLTVEGTHTFHVGETGVRDRSAPSRRRERSRVHPVTSDTAYLYLTRFKGSDLRSVVELLAAGGIGLTNPTTGLVRALDEVGDGRASSEDELVAAVDALDEEGERVAFQWW